MDRVAKVLVVALAFLLVLAGCSGDSDKQSSGNKDKKTTSTKHAVDVTEIKGKSERVITLHQGVIDAVAFLNVKPVGAVELWTQEPKLEYIRDDLKDIKTISQGPAPDLEGISKLKLDLIVASKVRSEKVYDQLPKIAPAVSTGAAFKFKDITKLMGKTLGKEREARGLLKKYDDKVAAFQKDMKAKYKDTWPLKASVVNFRADHTRIYADEYAGEILNGLRSERDEGLQKQVDNGKDIIRPASKESIPLMGADHIFVVKSGPNAKDTVLIEKAESEWALSKEQKDLDAIKNDQASDDLDEITWNLVGGYRSSSELIDDLYKKLNIEE